MDTSSVFFGVVIGIIGAFGTGFLKKAGEDLYSLLKAKISPNSISAPSPQIVVHLRDDRGDIQAATSRPTQLAPAAIERLSQVTFDDIEKTIDSAPPMQRADVARNFVGLKVEWDSYLRSANKQDNGMVSLRLTVDKDYPGRSVLCEVLAEEYRVLGVLPKGAHIRVSGEISKASTFDVELSNVRLHIFPSSPTA